MSTNSMNISELYSLYQRLHEIVDEDDNYFIDENGIWKLYNEILHGEAGRKDCLIYAICDMLLYIKRNNIEKPKSTLLWRFERIYGKKME